MKERVMEKQRKVCKIQLSKCFQKKAVNWRKREKLISYLSKFSEPVLCYALASESDELKMVT